MDGFTDRPMTYEDEARMYAQNADYWRGRAKAAERFYPLAYWWTFRRWVRDHITARVDWSKT